MISCTEFIPAYSELFKYIEKKGGKNAVIDFWKVLSERYLADSLRKNVINDGIRGCWDYWSRSLNEEAADFEMSLDTDAEEFRIDMIKCPSRSMLNEMGYMEPYKDYCEHCNWLYRLILEPLGYSCEVDMGRCGEAKCSVVVKKQK
jgi:hypothetical protein